MAQFLADESKDEGLGNALDRKWMIGITDDVTFPFVPATLMPKRSGGTAASVGM